MTTQLQALQTFTGPDGDYDKDEVFALDDAERVKFLIDGGYAQRITKAEAKEIAAAAPAPDAPSA